MALVSFQGDLFEKPDQGSRKLFDQAIEACLASERSSNRLRRASSEAVYLDMWNAFANWCIAESPPITMERLRPVDIQRFLASREGRERGSALTAKHAWRLTTLIDRVLSHVAASQGQTKVRVAAEVMSQRSDIRQANLEAAGLPDYLPADQARRLVSFLSSQRQRAHDSLSTARWQDLRNRTAVALHLGAGVTPGEVRQLSLQSPITAGARSHGVPWKIAVPEDGARRARETPIAPWAGQLLRHWLEVREGLGFPPDPQSSTPTHWLFPSTRKGKQWASAPHWKAVKEVLTDAAVEAVDGGAFRLRHTFALRQLRTGAKPADVARWMGIVARRRNGTLQPDPDRSRARDLRAYGASAVEANRRRCHRRLNL